LDVGFTGCPTAGSLLNCCLLYCKHSECWFGRAPPHGMARDCCVPPLLQKPSEYPWHFSHPLPCYPLSEVTVVYQNGLPVISVSLPSRRERCQFTLKPLSDCVGVFLQQLQAEDRGIDRVAIYSMGKDAHTLENF
ncbi:hypothetical protein XENOCAPTIV_017696, partial [Xenoophorus captivus]